MNPEELLDCEKCQYRKTILNHLGHAERATSEAIFDMLVAYGPESDVTLAMRDARIILDNLFWRIFGEAMHCEGEENIASPMRDDGYRDWGI